MNDFSTDSRRKNGFQGYVHGQRLFPLTMPMSSTALETRRPTVYLANVNLLTNQIQKKERREKGECNKYKQGQGRAGGIGVPGAGSLTACPPGECFNSLQSTRAIFEARISWHATKSCWCLFELGLGTTVGALCADEMNSYLAHINKRK